MDNVPNETHVVSVMTSKPLKTVAKGQRRNGRSSSLASHSQAIQCDIPCRFKFCKNPSCELWHPPVCLNYKSEKGCVHGDTCHFRHVEAEGKSNKRSKKGGAKRSVAILKESSQKGCVSQDSYPRKSTT